MNICITKGTCVLNKGIFHNFINIIFDSVHHVTGQWLENDTERGAYLH